MPRNEVEDGMGFSGLVPSREEKRQERELELHRAYMNNLPFCPDHRDKVSGKPCCECEIEHLKWIINSAKHLILAATGPDGGPTNWEATKDRWMKYADEVSA